MLLTNKLSKLMQINFILNAKTPPNFTFYLKALSLNEGEFKRVSKLLILTLLNEITNTMYRIPIRTLNRIKTNESFIKE